MQLDGVLKRHLLSNLSSVNAIMDLPITEKELNFIIESVKNKNIELYNKLWSYRFNKNVNKNVEINKNVCWYCNSLQTKD